MPTLKAMTASFKCRADAGGGFQATAIKEWKRRLKLRLNDYLGEPNLNLVRSSYNRIYSKSATATAVQQQLPA